MLMVWAAPAQAAGGDLSVMLVSPAAGQTFTASSNIQLIAKAVESIGTVTNVEFYVDGRPLGAGSMLVLDPPGINGVTGPVYLFTWLSPTVGLHVLTVKAGDNGGGAAVSQPVSVMITGAPVLAMSSPAITNGALVLVFNLSVSQGSNLSYTLLQTEAVTGPWITNHSAVLATNSQSGGFQFTLPLSAASGFYRLRSP